MTDTYSSQQPQPPVPGLLSPDQFSGPASDGLMSLGAGLIKAGGPSPYKNNFSGVGDALLGGLDAYHRSTTQALTNQYLKGQINKQAFDQLMQVSTAIAQYRGADLPVPPYLQAIADKAGFSSPPPQGGPAPTASGPTPLEVGPRSLTMPPLVQGGPAPAGPPPMPPPGLLSPQGGPGPVVASAGGGSILPFQPGTPPPQIMGGGAPPSGLPPGLLSPQGGPAPISFDSRIPPNGGMPPAGPPPGLLSPAAPPPQVQPAPQPQGGPASVASLVKSLPQQDRYALIGGGPVGKIVEGVTQKNMEQTPEGKNARDPAVLDFETKKLQGAADVKNYTALHSGLSGAAFTAANAKPYNDAAAAIIQDPKFFSGSGEEMNLGYKRFLAASGIDPGAALPQEAFRKVMAANILQQVNSLKAEAEAMGQNGGRIFGSQIEMMEKAAQNPDNSIAANRYLTELSARVGARTQRMADMADDYATQHGRLDAGFEKGLRKWMNDTPVFSGAELKNQNLVGNPDAGKPTHFASDGKGGRLGYVNGQMVPVDKDGTPLPNVGASR